jgi:hypothetical protein
MTRLAGFFVGPPAFTLWIRWKILSRKSGSRPGCQTLLERRSPSTIFKAPYSLALIATHERWDDVAPWAFHRFSYQLPKAELASPSAHQSDNRSYRRSMDHILFGPVPTLDATCFDSLLTTTLCPFTGPRAIRSRSGFGPFLIFWDCHFRVRGYRQEISPPVSGPGSGSRTTSAGWQAGRSFLGDYGPTTPDGFNASQPPPISAVLGVHPCKGKSRAPRPDRAFPSPKAEPVGELSLLLILRSPATYAVLRNGGISMLHQEGARPSGS